MLDIDDTYDALKTRLPGIKTDFAAASGKARATAHVWLYWSPAIVLAIIAGYCL